MPFTAIHMLSAFVPGIQLISLVVFLAAILYAFSEPLELGSLPDGDDDLWTFP